MVLNTAAMKQSNHFFSQSRSCFLTQMLQKRFVNALFIGMFSLKIYCFLPCCFYFAVNACEPFLSLCPVFLLTLLLSWGSEWFPSFERRNTNGERAAFPFTSVVSLDCTDLTALDRFIIIIF